MKVKCISNKGSEKYLTVGKIYEAQEWSNASYSVVGDHGQQFTPFKERFELVNDTPKFVKCIRPNTQGTLIKGRIYQVEQCLGSKGQQYNLYGEDPKGPWDADRFEIVSGLIVRCEDDTDQPEDYTEEQKVKVTWLYQPKKVNLNRYTGERYEINGVLFSTSRFEAVSDVNPATAQTVPAPKNQGPIDVEEERIWAAWTAPAPGNCRCNVPPPCPYHPQQRH